jgi:hypothetical protein
MSGSTCQSFWRCQIQCYFRPLFISEFRTPYSIKKAETANQNLYLIYKSLT